MNSSLKQALQYSYNNLVRPHLPRKISVYNGVSIRYIRFLDFTDHVPDWKEGTVSSVKDTVTCGDRVVEIGSGFGVCTVWAARRAGDDGGVTTYEASENRYGILNETLRLNGVSNRVETNHALVGEKIDVFGELATADEIYPVDLPQCDVLITDCEGAEMQILSALRDQDGFNPRSMVIETHGFAGASTDAVIDELQEQGYEITSIKDASPYGSPEEDNKVVTAEQHE